MGDNSRHVDGANSAIDGREEIFLLDDIDKAKDLFSDELNQLIFVDSPTLYDIPTIVNFWKYHGERVTMEMIRDNTNILTELAYGSDHPEYKEPPPEEPEPEPSVHSNNIDASGAFDDFY